MGLLDDARNARKLKKLANEAKKSGAAGAGGEQMDPAELVRKLQEDPSAAAALFSQQTGTGLEGVQGAGTQTGAPDALRDQVLASLGVNPGSVVAGQVATGAGSSGKLQVKFTAEAHGPGDSVDGVIVATEPIKARSVEAHLRYVDQSHDYGEGVNHVSSGSLHKGSLEEGLELPFSMTLPSDALPNWQQSLEGTLLWTVMVEVDIARRRDIQDLIPIPVKPEPGLWRGPEVGDPGDPEVKRVSRGWDVEIQSDRHLLRRGEELNVEVRIGKPAADRSALKVGLVCEAHADYESTSTSTDSDGHSQTTTSRETAVTTAVENWAQIDPNAPTQRVQVRVPEEAPFSYLYKKGAFGFKWKLVAREDLSLRRDPRREVTLQVLP